MRLFEFDKKLVHFATEPISKLVHRIQHVNQPAFKPAGLWVSDEAGYGWEDWCREEHFGIGKFKYEIILSRNAKILLLDTAGDIAWLEREFGMPLHPEISARYINWDRVSERWDGLFIMPYQWSQRLEFAWYYGWDCSSGCIWNIDIVQTLIKVDKRLVNC